VFVGAGSIILPNVTIGDNVIIGAGSVVTRSIPENCVYAGNPARFVCAIEEHIEKHRANMECSPVFDVEFTLRGCITDEKKSEQYNALENKIGYVK
jgi:maltose O-acetyltransferase